MLWLIPLHFLLCFILFYSKNILQLAGASDELAFCFNHSVNNGTFFYLYHPVGLLTTLEMKNPIELTIT